MRIHFIKENDLDIAYFPDTLRFFRINTLTEKIINAYLNNEQKADIINKYHIKEEEYDLIINKIKGAGELPEFTDRKAPILENRLEKLVIHISNTCNLGCKYCYANGGSYNSDSQIMPVETAIYIIDKFFKNFENIDAIQLFGGEPLLNLPAIKAIGECIDEKYSKGEISKKPSITLVTNGTILNSEVVDLIKKYDIKITVSLDGPVNVNDKARVYKDGRGTGNLIVNNIKSMKEQTQQPSEIEVTYNRYHVNEKISVVDILNYLKDELDYNSAHIVPVNGERDLEYSLENMNSFVDSVDDIFNNLDNKNKIMSSFVQDILQRLDKKQYVKFMCQAGVNTLAVSVKGDIYPCFLLVDKQEEKLGNIFDDDIFDSELFKKGILKFCNFNKYEYTKCKDCFNNTLCHGCVGLNYFSNGKLFEAPEENCEMFKSMAEKVIINIVKRQKKVV